MELLAVLAGICLLAMALIVFAMTIMGIYAWNAAMVLFPVFYSLVFLMLLSQLQEDASTAKEYTYTYLKVDFTKFVCSVGGMLTMATMVVITIIHDINMILLVINGIMNIPTFLQFSVLPSIIVFFTAYYHYRVRNIALPYLKK